MVSDRMRVCYACKSTFHKDHKVSADHNGLPVQICPSCAVKAGIIDTVEEAKHD